jgi:hypothetical protein
MRWDTIRARKGHAHGLRKIIDPREYEIEATCTDAPPFEFRTEQGAQLIDHAVEIFRIPERLGEFQLTMGYFGRNERGDASVTLLNA